MSRCRCSPTGTGSAVHLFERDCTLQRRHQKIIEEAPAPGLTPELRAALGKAATGAALAAGYENAGTVEFLLDQAGGFYFIEMNTRLQVEHPVTEAITGLDLVEWQLRIAAGEPLPLRQEEIVGRGPRLRGAALRRGPGHGASCRRSAGCGRCACRRGWTACGSTPGSSEGDAVTPYYDPMIAKIIAHGADRPAALERLAAALDATQVEGVTTNLGLPARGGRQRPSSGRCGSIPAGSTAKARRRWPPRDRSIQPTLLLAALATVALSVARPGPAPRPGTDWTSPWHRLDAWRLNQPPRGLVRLLDGKDLHMVIVEGTAERYTARLGDHDAAGPLRRRRGSGLDRERRAAAQLPGGDRRPHADASRWTDDAARWSSRTAASPRAARRRTAGCSPPHAGQGDQAAGGGRRPGRRRASRWPCWRP